VNEYRSVLERVGSNFAPLDLELETILRRRDRKRRNQRITAGVVGIAVFVAAVWVVTSGLSLDRSDSSVVPAGDGTAPGVKAQSAGAVDEGFRGWYRVITRGDGYCRGSGGDNGDRVQVRYVDEGVRYLAHAGLVWNGRLRYMPGEPFPWQTIGTDPRKYELRYNPSTERAIGNRYGIQGAAWCVRLIPID
jgi:hypothetical protein